MSCETTHNLTNTSKNEVVEVAILMPMSGPNSVAGQQYNKLIKMGLNDGIKTDIKVTSYDGSDEKSVLVAMEKIVAKKTKIILGPLYSPLTSLIAEKAKRNNIIIITMSNNPALADDRLFVFGHTPLKQLEKIMDSLLDGDYKSFIALLPAGNHSQNVVKIIQETTIQKNASLARVEYYMDTPESIDKSVHLVSDAVDSLNEIEDSTHKPIIYISDDVKNLNLLFASINKYNLSEKATIVGDNRLDINYPEPINLMFTGSFNMLKSHIPVRAQGLGISHINFMHAMAYDLGKLTAERIGENFTDEKFLKRLNDKQVFPGISGNITFIDSIAARTYDIIKH